MIRRMRAWDRVRRIMVLPDTQEYNILMALDGSFTVAQLPAKIKRGIHTTEEIWDSIIMRSADEFDLMDYIGLKDRSGGDICEGDFIMDTDEQGGLPGDKYAVTWNDVAVQFMGTMKDDNGEIIWTEIFDSTDFVIVGNILQHPNLL